MIRTRFCIPFACLLALAATFMAGCLPFGGPRHTSAAPIQSEAMRRYLLEANINSAQAVSAATGRIQRGESYRTRLRDRYGRYQLLTVWMDPETPRLLHIRTEGDIPCPTCKGTGIRKMPFNSSIDFRCIKCDGDGVLESELVEWKYILSDRDLAGGTRSVASRDHGMLTDPPLGPIEKRRIRDLISDNPETRLHALRWLDANYIREGAFFQEAMPMLRKARWIETDPEGRVTVYQFWAGRETYPDQAYYRVYVDAREGEIMKAGFVNERGEFPEGAPGASDLVEKKLESVREFFRWKEN